MALRLNGANKFNARKTVVNGLTFDSAKEARRYQELMMLQKAGEVREVEVHPKFDLMAHCPATVFLEGMERPERCDWTPVIGKYTPDFRVVYATGEIVFEDVKSEPSKTESYRLRKRIWEANYWPLTITEI